MNASSSYSRDEMVDCECRGNQMHVYKYNQQKFYDADRIIKWFRNCFITSFK